MRRAGGYSLIFEPGKADIEQDTFTCGHCNRVSFVAVGNEPEFRCKTCFAFICDHCANKPCLPLEEQLRMMEDGRYRPRKIFKMDRR